MSGFPRLDNPTSEQRAEREAQVAQWRKMREREAFIDSIMPYVFLGGLGMLLLGRLLGQ